MQKTWDWYHSFDDETWYGPHRSRKEAIAELDGQAGYVGEHRKPEINLGVYFDVEDFCQSAYENIQERWGGEDNDVEIDYTDKQADDLQARVSAVINQWQTDHRVYVKTWGFAESRNVEQIESLDE